jgi:hypothetical protein
MTPRAETKGKKGLTRVSRKGERAFFFYATLGMGFFWGVTRLWGG